MVHEKCKFRVKREGKGLFLPDFIITAVTNGLGSAFTMGSFTILFLSLSGSDFGHFVVVLGISRLVVGVLSLNAWQVLIPRAVQLIAGGKAVEVRRLYGSALAADLAAFPFVLVTAVFVAGILPWALGHVKLEWFVLLCAAQSLSFTGFATTVLRSEGKFATLGWMEVLVHACRFTVISIFASSSELNTLLLLWIVVEFAGGVLRLACTLLCISPYMLGLVFLIDGGRSLVANSTAIYAIFQNKVWTLMRLGTLELDTLIVAFFVGSTEAGLYRYARQWALLINRAGELTQQVVHTHISRVQNSSELLSSIRKYNLFGFALGASVFMVGLFVIGVLGIGDAGRTTGMLVAMVAIFAAASVIYLAGVAYVPALIFIKQDLALMKITAVATSLFFVFAFVLTPVIGGLGAAGAHLIFNLVWLALCRWQLYAVRGGLERAFPREIATLNNGAGDKV